MEENNKQIDSVSIGIEILNYAVKHNLSLQESCIVYGKHKKYVSDIKKRKERHLKNPLYNQFLQLHEEYMKRKFQKLKDEITSINDDLSSEVEPTSNENISWDENSETAQVTLKLANVQINNLEEALAYSKVDLSIWEVERHIFNTWTTSAKLPAGEGFQKITNIQVKIWFRKKIEPKLKTDWNNFLEEIKNFAPNYISYKQNLINKYESLIDKKYSLEISVPDLHIGKLGHRDEVGENFDTKIAIQRYNESIDKLLANILHLKGSIEEIVLPIGNDMLNTDNKNNTTTAGTPQSVDSRWYQMFWKAKNLLINTIDKLSMIAPVKVIVVSGNHDSLNMFHLGDSILSWYRNSDRVEVNNDPTQRKYYTYGTNLIGFTHGNEEKHQELGLIMATEKPELWSKSKFREIHLGHFHSRKVIKYTEVQEFQGFKIRILPSLSGTDAWHNSKGYMSIKSAVAFLYDKDNGLVAEYSHNIL